jgi:RND superfamily putative drug exporter
MISRLARFVSGRRTKWVVLGLWLVGLIASMGANLPGKFADAEKNESRSFLPEAAESTKALDVTERLQDGDTAPTVVVYRREGGLTPADRATIARDRAELNRITAAYANTTPFSAPQIAEDGTSALLRNVLRGTGESDDLLDPVGEYRDAVSDPGGGLAVKVAGPAGYAADAIEVFEGINGTLLMAAMGLVIVLLILIYRSPFFWFFALLAVIVAEIGARVFGWGLTEAGVTVNGQSSALLSILVIGAGTDYALLLVARYREELRTHEDRHEAMALALRRAGPAIFASGLTVCAALLTLTLAEVNATAGLGPIGAMGIAVAVLVMLTFLPALLVAIGRKPFWPSVPRFGAQGADETHGAWRSVAERVARAPRRVWVAGVLLLVMMSAGLANFSDGLTQSNSFRNEVESVQGQELIAKAFPQGQAAPTDIVLGDASKVGAVVEAASAVDGVARVDPRPVAQDAEGLQLAAFLEFDPYSTEAYAVVEPLREAVRSADPTALVGGPSAIEQDLRDAAGRDTRLLVPLALVIVLLILTILLRALVAPLLLILTVVLSYLAALGAGAVIFDVIFGFPGSDPSLPLFAFVFLVALGVDYNIFLMARVREETLARGTRIGMIRGVAVTGGVITSAGIVLAGTFAVLGVLPLVFLTEIGFVIAFGVLLDTFLVRSVIVPALVFDIGPRVWWPSALARRDEPHGAHPDTSHDHDDEGG